MVVSDRRGRRKQFLLAHCLFNALQDVVDNIDEIGLLFVVPETMDTPAPLGIDAAFDDSVVKRVAETLELLPFVLGNIAFGEELVHLSHVAVEGQEIRIRYTIVINIGLCETLRDVLPVRRDAGEVEP